MLQIALLNCDTEEIHPNVSKYIETLERDIQALGTAGQEAIYI